MKKVCGTCALWKPHLPRRPDLGGRCLWVSTEVWPASVKDVPGVRRAIALMMDAESGEGCKLWTDEIECASEGSVRQDGIAAARAESTAAPRKRIRRRP